MKEFVITFHTHFEALVCMRFLKSNKNTNKTSFNIKIIPVPRAVSSSCGTAIRIHAENFTTKELKELEYDSLFRLKGKKEYIKIN